MARIEVLAELDALLLSLRDEPVVVRIRSSDLNALQIAADGLGLREGQWGFDLRLRPGCAQELVRSLCCSMRDIDVRALRPASSPATGRSSSGHGHDPYCGDEHIRLTPPT